MTAAYVDSGNTFANVISPQTMSALGLTIDQLEPVPQLSVGTAAAGKTMKVLGQAPRVDLTFRSHPTKFRIRPLVLQGLVHPLNLCGPFLAHCGMDQLHSKKALQIQGKVIPMYQPKARRSLPPAKPGTNVRTLEIPTPTRQVQPHNPQGPDHQVAIGEDGVHIDGRTRQIVRLKVHPPLPTGTPIIFRPLSTSGLGPHDVVQTVGPASTVTVLYVNLRSEALDWQPQKIVGALNVASCQPEGPPPTKKGRPLSPRKTDQLFACGRIIQAPQKTPLPLRSSRPSRKNRRSSG